MEEKIVNPKIKKFQPDIYAPEVPPEDRRMAIREAVFRAIVAMEEVREQMKFQQALKDAKIKAGIIKPDDLTKTDDAELTR